MSLNFKNIAYQTILHLIISRVYDPGWWNSDRDKIKITDTPPFYQTQESFQLKSLNGLYTITNMKNRDTE